jgi:hypothetical protein
LVDACELTPVDAEECPLDDKSVGNGWGEAGAGELSGEETPAANPLSHSYTIPVRTHNLRWHPSLPPLLYIKKRHCIMNKKNVCRQKKVVTVYPHAWTCHSNITGWDHYVAPEWCCLSVSTQVATSKRTATTRTTEQFILILFGLLTTWRYNILRFNCYRSKRQFFQIWLPSFYFCCCYYILLLVMPFFSTYPAHYNPEVFALAKWLRHDTWKKKRGCQLLRAYCPSWPINHLWVSVIYSY